MKNYYKALGLNQSSSADDIRRAYRILARRYHPDVNPGTESKQKFQEILEAYEVLSDEKARKTYNSKFESFQRRNINKQHERYQEELRRSAETPKDDYKFGSGKPEQEKEAAPPPPRKSVRNKIESKITSARNWIIDQWYSRVDQDEAAESEEAPMRGRKIRKVSIVEASVTVFESIRGSRKKIEISEPEGTRHVNVMIPRGVRDGSVIRLRDKNNEGEDLVLIVRLTAHPFIQIKAKGLVIEIPITIHEALSGAQISVPGVDDEILVKVPPGTQSGAELRIKGKGIPGADSAQGDLFVRFLIRIPEATDAFGLKDKGKELEKYYESNVRHDIPKTLSGVTQ